MAVLLTVCEIFSRIEVENRQFRQMYFDCRSFSRFYRSNAQQHQRNRNRWKVHGLQFCHWH